jgi:hypothetical protein
MLSASSPVISKVLEVPYSEREFLHFGHEAVGTASPPLDVP